MISAVVIQKEYACANEGLKYIKPINISKFQQTENSEQAHKQNSEQGEGTGFMPPNRTVLQASSRQISKLIHKGCGHPNGI